MHNILAELQILVSDPQSLQPTTPLPLTSTSLPHPSSLPYTMAVFNESLRLYPPVPFEIKQSTTATTLPDGTFLPAKSVVVSCIWAMNRSESIWGPDACEFRPERWLLEADAEGAGSDTGVAGKNEDNATPIATPIPLPEHREDKNSVPHVDQLNHNHTHTSTRNLRKRKVLTKTAAEFPVFHGGPRSCLGRKMAEILAVYVIASLVWEFEFEAMPVPDGENGGAVEGKKTAERRSRNSLTLPMEGGLPVVVRAR